MIERIDPWVRGKRVLILGFGREGQSTFQVLKRLGSCAAIGIADQREPSGNVPDGAVWHSGADYQSHMDEYDVVFKSPGIVLERPIEEYRCQVLSQAEVFFQIFRDQIVGITGTKGKSTITSLLYHILKSAGKDCTLMGNIGIPAFDRIEEIDAKTQIVFELSCHQLEYMTVSPHIAILVNIHEEHLDHYGTMEKYVAAKENIFRNQKAEDVLVCNVQCLPKEGTCPSHLLKVDLNGANVDINVENSRENAWAVDYAGERYEIPVDEIRLLGEHNYFDIGMVYAVARMLGVEAEAFSRGLKTYEPLPHRLQLIGVKDGVKYYDDSISTIGDTAIQAMKTLIDTDAVLIGGMDRGIEYDDLIAFLSECSVPHIVLMEETGWRILREIEEKYPQFSRKERLIVVDHLEDAVEVAKRVCRSGHSCLLSPAAASYGIFKNFEERGEAFRKMVGL